ncbi:MAG: hypothetical protein WD398_15120 [Cyclobacteriaceae bacterium]
MCDFPITNSFTFPIHWLFLLVAMASCNLEDSRRLQINQAYEGDEIYLISKALDEPLHLAFKGLMWFQNQAFTDTLPGCPTITIVENDNEVHHEVQLNYSTPICKGPSNQKGLITLHFSSSQLTQMDSIHLTFEDYQSGAFTLNGDRIFTLIDSTIQRATYSEQSENLLIMDQHQSSSRVGISFFHEITHSEAQGRTITSTGSLEGRNWAGNNLSMEIETAKVLTATCMNQGIFRPVEGRESWTVYRTDGVNVNHRLRFVSTADCTTKTILLLDEGVQIEKSP